MSNIIILSLILCCVLIFGCSNIPEAILLEKEAADLHKEIVTIDTHTDTPLNLIQKDFDITKSHDAKKEHSKVDFPRMKKGGLDAVFFAAFISQGPRTPAGNTKAEENVSRIIDSIRSVINKNPQMAALALTAEDAARIKSEGKLAIYTGIENGYAIGNDLSLIKKYYDKGIRYMTLCHTKDNDICGSSMDPDTLNKEGLSDFGKIVVSEMNKCGMIVDISHISDKAFYDVLNITKVPVIASHSCARALCNHPRNLDDDMLKKLAANGGVIQMCILSDYVKTGPVNPERDSVLKAFHQRYSDFDKLSDSQKNIVRDEYSQINKKYPQVLASVSDVVDHIDHIVAIAGINHVGIGTDFDGGAEVNGCFDVSEMKNITIELLKRKYSHEDIRKIWGGNFLRVFRQIEQFASKVREN